VVGRCNDVDGWTRCCRWCVKGDGLGLSDVFVQLCTGFVGRWVDVVCWGLQELPSWRPLLCIESIDTMHWTRYHNFCSSRFHRADTGTSGMDAMG
jgi:hypothetical protein